MKLLLLLSLLVPQIFPTPTRVEVEEGSVALHSPLRVRACPEAQSAVQLLGESVAVRRARRGGDLTFVCDTTIAAEGYRLRVARGGVEVRASGHSGFVYAVQTLRQLDLTALPLMEIDDSPRLSWRAFMLDSGRQYQSVATIKRYIDLCSRLKMNRFHWHLTEGLGWRLEIKKYPRLAAEGGFVATGPEQQGYYTQEEVRSLVAYAAARAVEIVPEIDLPGHAEAVLHVYPYLGCTRLPATIPTEGFTPQIFCAGRDSTIAFLEDVLTEVLDLFPSRYIHLGGDEAPKDHWARCPDCQRRIREEGLADEHALQGWLSARLGEWLAERGRTAIFWEDALGEHLPAGCVIQWWNYRGHGNRALRQGRATGHPVIASPNYYCYLNFPTEPWRGYHKDRTFTLEDAYLRNPACASDEVMGLEAALWTDYGLTEAMLDERLFPRIYALAQHAWHQGSPLSWDDFLRLVALQRPR